MAADGFDLTSAEEDAHDEWGGRGGGAHPPAYPEAGATTMVVNAITTPSVSAGQSAQRGDSGEGGRGAAGGKRRWRKGGWAAVDVRAVQSRISRIVDDTSARIRSSVVVKVWRGTMFFPCVFVCLSVCLCLSCMYCRLRFCHRRL